MLFALATAGSAPPARASGELTLTPGAVNFGRVWVGQTHALRVKIANTGNAAVTLSGDTVTGSGYSVSGIKVPLSLSAGATATFEVKFTPQSVGTSSGTLKLISNAGNGTVAIALTGLGVGRSASTGYVNATPLTAQFGNVPVGTMNTQSIQVQNTGQKTVSISSVAATGTGFSVSGMTTPYTLAAGAAAQLTIGFQPASAGSANGAVTIASTASDSSLSVSVSGTGTTVTRVLSASPASVAFGNVNVSSSVTQTVTLTNSGNSDLTISSDAVSGTGLSASGIGGTTLAPGQSTTVTAGFAPKAAGSVAGSITIASNATNGASMSVPVSGTGVSAAAGHTVALNWQPSPSSGVNGYNVYRSIVSGGPYTRISSPASSVTSYADSGVSSGTTYYYAVTATGSDGEESTYSNEVSAAIP